MLIVEQMPEFTLWLLESNCQLLSSAPHCQGLASGPQWLEQPVLSQVL